MSAEESVEAIVLTEIVANSTNAAGMSDKVVHGGNGEMGNSEHYEDPGTPLENEYHPQDESEDEDDIQITIGDLRTNVTFNPPPGGQRGTGGATKHTQKLDIDATANSNGVPIFDLDLASLEEKPWRKPGADITDYFNYGFVEETWQIYCERQRKLRAEYGSAVSANKQLFSSMTNLAPVGTAQAGDTKQSAKIFPMQSSNNVNLGAPPPSAAATTNEIPIIMRTVISVPQISESSAPQPATVLTPAVPTPAVQPLHQQQQQSNIQTVHSLAPSVPVPQPSIHTIQTIRGRANSSPPESPNITPPPDDEFPVNARHPPSSSASAADLMLPGGGNIVSGPGPSSTSSADHLPFVDLSIPPPRFPPTNLPPPGFPPHGLPPGVPGLPPTNVPPPMFPPGPLPPPGMPMRFPPPFGFPPPGGPRLQPFRDGYAGFSQIPREDVRSPASYSDKSSEDEREKYDRHRRSRGGDHYRRSHSRSHHRHSSRERSSRHVRHRSRSSKERSTFYGRSGEHGDEQQLYHGEHRRDRDRERSQTRERSKVVKTEDEELQKIKKRKIKEEPMDEDELAGSAGKKPKERSEHKDRSSSSGKKRKKTKERHDEDEGAESNA